MAGICSNLPKTNPYLTDKIQLYLIKPIFIHEHCVYHLKFHFVFDSVSQNKKISQSFASARRILRSQLTSWRWWDKAASAWCVLVKRQIRCLFTKYSWKSKHQWSSASIHQWQWVLRRKIHTIGIMAEERRNKIVHFIRTKIDATTTFNRTITFETIDSMGQPMAQAKRIQTILCHKVSAVQ